MTSCAYIYLYVQYKTRLITECTIHCLVAWDCFLIVDNLLCLVLPRLHLLLLGQLCEVVSLSICYGWPSKTDMNRDLTTGVLKIRTKKETIKRKGDCKGTLDRLLALFSATFNQTALGLSEDTTTGGLANTPAQPITKQVPMNQWDSNRVPLHCYGSREKTDNDAIHTLYKWRIILFTPSFRHNNCKTERQSQFFVP